MIARSSVWAAIVVAMVSLAACSDETVVVPETGGVGGRISGVVSGPDGPIQTYLRFESIARESGIDSPVAGVGFSLLPPGDYRVELDVEYLDAVTKRVRSVHFWLPSDLVAEDATPLELRAGETSSYEMTATVARFTIQVSVDGVWSSLGLRPPQVWIATEDSVEVTMGDCDEAGIFSEQFWAHAPIKIAIGGRDNRHWIGGANFDEATLFSPQVDGEILEARFTDSAIGVRFGGEHEIGNDYVRFELFDESGARVALHRASSSSPGGLVVPYLQPGRFRLMVAPEQFLESDWLAQWHHQAADLEHATTIEVVAEGEVGSVEVEVESGARIRGTIRDLLGAPSSSALYLTSANATRVLGAIFAHSADGKYELRGVPPGEYKVGAFQGHDRFEDTAELGPDARWYPNQISWHDAEIITITGTETVAAIDFSLP